MVDLSDYLFITINRRLGHVSPVLLTASNQLNEFVNYFRRTTLVEANLFCKDFIKRAIDVNRTLFFELGSCELQDYLHFGYSNPAVTELEIATRCYTAVAVS